MAAARICTYKKAAAIFLLYRNEPPIQQKAIRGGWVGILIRIISVKADIRSEQDIQMSRDC